MTAYDYAAANKRLKANLFDMVDQRDALIKTLQMVYDNIPECSCTIEYTSRNLRDPGCVRHFMFFDEEVDLIRASLETVKTINQVGNV